jgi:hypothetical protein
MNKCNNYSKEGLLPMKMISRVQRRGESAVFALVVELGNLVKGLNGM